MARLIFLAGMSLGDMSQDDFSSMLVLSKDSALHNRAKSQTQLSLLSGRVEILSEQLRGFCGAESVIAGTYETWFGSIGGNIFDASNALRQDAKMECELVGSLQPASLLSIASASEKVANVVDVLAQTADIRDGALHKLRTSLGLRVLEAFGADSKVHETIDRAEVWDQDFRKAAQQSSGLLSSMKSMVASNASLSLLQEHVFGDMSIQEQQVLEEQASQLSSVLGTMGAVICKAARETMAMCVEWKDVPILSGHLKKVEPYAQISLDACASTP